METFFVLWSEEPFVVLGFLASLLVAAYLFAYGAKVRVRAKQQPSLLASERRALQAERDAEHERRRTHRERAAHLRLVAERMPDDHEAA